jgi:hypothetical protein
MKGLATLERIRPEGYEYPVGLTGQTGGPTSVDYLVVAGGGGGGGLGGGGGAGGFRTATGFSISKGTPYSITVGGGGPGSPSSPANGINGSNSVFS